MANRNFEAAGARVAALSILQVSAWWLLLLMNGATWWDDWVMRSLTPSELAEYFKETGRPYFYPIHWLLMHTNWTWYHPVILAASLGITVFFYLILRNTISERLAFASASFLAVLPMITTRVLAIFTPFMLGLLTFFIGWWLISRARKTMTWGVRIAIFGLWMFAFTTASLLVWVMLPLAHLFGISFKKFSWKNLGIFAAREWLLISSPFVFWLLNRIFARPYGWYAEYNNPVAFLHEPKMFIILSVVGVVAAVIAIILVKRFNRHINTNLDLALAAVFSILLGSIPYLAIGRNPWHFYGFADRFGLLYPYGFAVLLAIVIKLIARFSATAGKISTAIALVLGILLTNAGLSQYLLDNRVQSEIITQLRASHAWQASPTLLIKNNASRLFANGRTNPHYELTAWAQQAAGNRVHLAINADELGVWVKLGHFARVPKYGAHDYEPNDSGTLIEINPKADAQWPAALFESTSLVSLGFRPIPSLNKLYEESRK